MTGRCYDFAGPTEPVIARAGGWVPITKQSAAELAFSGMLLACSPEHVEKLVRRQEPGAEQRQAA